MKNFGFKTVLLLIVLMAGLFAIQYNYSTPEPVIQVKVPVDTTVQHYKAFNLEDFTTATIAYTPGDKPIIDSLKKGDTVWVDEKTWSVELNNDSTTMGYEILERIK